MKSAEIRSAFLSYFESKQHQIVESSSLIPGDDPTLLFTNAGMVQFKDVFLGTDKRQYHRATSSQRCVRAGGKHNDLENVGYTARHHTFFEMLGNFSFGDYFKKDAIYFAWEFLTQILGLPEEKLWITVHINDDEAADIWLNDVGVSADRFSRLDEDNFWQMGDTGPCGPSSEIFYDHGSDVPGGPPGSEGDDLDRYIEIWNLVFMQYERQPDATLEALPKPSVDTGMGLERIAAVMQGVHTNYDIDLFQALLAAAAKATETTNLAAKSLRVIADHIRSCSFLVSDGVLPSNEGRGYVLRRIIRRAIRHGNQLGQKHVFFSTLVSSLVGQMGDAYPELKENQTHIENVLLAEEVQFAKTLDKGMLVLDDKLANLKGTVIPGDIIFALYDTYGFPVDLTNDIARERHLSLDMEAYDVLMEAQRKKSKEAGVFKADYTNKLDLDSKTEFVGYESLIAQGKVLAILVDGKKIQSLDVDIAATVVLDKTPFYGESGGQVGDAGYLYGGKSRSTQFDVINTLKYGDVHLHEGKLLSGTLSIGDDVDAAVDSGVRAATARNHSATHLMHATLRAVLGDHVTQKGSLVDSKRLRFDFSHTQAVSDAELNEISRMVNKHIRANVAVSTDLCDIKAAKAKGALALFGEKYGSEVRVLSMGEHDFSVELCGGTHVRRTGDIQFFDMVSESGIASGIRRIEAVTGEQAFALVEEMRAQNQALADQLKTDKDNIPVKVLQMLKHNKELEKSVAELKSKLASVSMNEWLAEAQSVNGVTLLVKQLENVDAKELRVMSDRLKDKLGDSSAVLLASITGGKIALVAGVSKKAISKVKAGDIVRHVASLVGGKGGGRPDMAQGGGTDVDALPSALTQVRALLD